MIYNLKKFARAGVGFGITSGVITTLGVITGLQSGTESAKIIIGGIITIAIADAFSDALGIHTSEEAEGGETVAQIWTATITAFSAKFLTVLSFAIPFVLLDLKTAIVVSIIWGALLLAIFSYTMAKSEKKNPYYTILEHLLIAAVVVMITHYAGKYVGDRLR